MKDRGQALTLEGSLAAMMIVLSLVFALQVSAVTPLTESTSSQHIENQQKEVGENVLGIAAEEELLKPMVLYWDPDHESEDGGGFIDAPDMRGGSYPNGVPTDTQSDAVEDFGTLLDRSFSDRGIAYNIYVNYVDGDSIGTEQIVDQGQPSDHSATVTRTVTLYDEDRIAGNNQLGENEDDFYANDEADSNVYNVVEVELVIWRM